MYACSELPFVNLTLATFRFAELGFFGLAMMMAVQTPLRCGDVLSSGALDSCERRVGRFLRFIAWFIVASAGREL